MAQEKHDYDYHRDTIDSVEKSKAQWREELSADVFHITREAGTEPAFSGKYHDYKEQGVYVCANCQHELFSSRTKYDSKTGWPSFWSPIANLSIRTQRDWKLIIPRNEVVCARCGAHLGHVFSDGPEPTGLRYCMNSLALDFKSKPVK